MSAIDSIPPVEVRFPRFILWSMSRLHSVFVCSTALFLLGSLLPATAAERDPGPGPLSAANLALALTPGWNLGNSLEAIGGETAWGNPPAGARLLQAVKRAGFRSVRIPVAWSQFSDEKAYTIKRSWKRRVAEVVDLALENDLSVIINIHWDGGWMQPTYAAEAEVNRRLAAMWKQIAIHFRDHDHRLLFAGTNEVMKEGDWGPPTDEYAAVQNGFNQTFVKTVRATGGRNADRFLIVQGFNTNIEYTLKHFVMPRDPAENRLAVEVHYYDPFDFTLNEESSITQWGRIAKDPAKTADWGGEKHAQRQFRRLKERFVDRGIPVVMGEYGVIRRPDVAGHESYRIHWNATITRLAVENGLVPVYWDNGFPGKHGLGLFDRKTGVQIYPDLVDAIVGAAQEGR